MLSGGDGCGCGVVRSFVLKNIQCKWAVLMVNR